MTSRWRFLRVREGGRQLFHAVRGKPFGQLVRQVLRVEVGDRHAVAAWAEVLAEALLAVLDGKAQSSRRSEG
jgi:hypothetical protein